MSPKSTATPSTEIVIDPRCKYVAASGRRCRAPGYFAFCLPHAQMEQQFLNAESVAEDLIGPINDFRTNLCVNEVLGNLLKLVAQNRIPIRHANTLAYICQLILSSNPGVRQEMILSGGTEYELQIINSSMDTMYGESEDEEESDEENSEEEGEADQPDEKKTTFQSQVDAVVKILGGVRS
jgi:hypothetical protein